MESKSIIKNKSEDFAVRIVNLYRYLCSHNKEFVLSNQLLRSGTSIGANVAEASGAFSKNDFVAKMQIAFKECLETQYWLQLLNKTNFISDKEYQSIIVDCCEIGKILSAILKKSKL